MCHKRSALPVIQDGSGLTLLTAVSLPLRQGIAAQPVCGVVCTCQASIGTCKERHGVVHVFIHVLLAMDRCHVPLPRTAATYRCHVPLPCTAATYRCHVPLQLAAAQGQLLVAGQALGAGVQLLLLLCK
jgi:hypothetical protein